MNNLLKLPTSLVMTDNSNFYLQNSLFKSSFSQLNLFSQKSIIDQMFLGKNHKHDILKAIIYLIAPHNQTNINETEIFRLNHIRSLFYRFNINVNMEDQIFFTSFLNFSIFFRQEKIALYFLSLGADINYVDKLGLSPINYLCAKILIGEEENKKTSILNDIRDKIHDKGLMKVLDKMINHPIQKLEYFHKNPTSSYCLYDAYATSQIKNMPSADDYFKIYQILSSKIQEISMNEKLSKHYAVELVEFKGSFCATKTSPQFFDQYKKMNKGNIFEFIIACDEEGAIEYLKENPSCVNETDLDLQNPLQWAIFMSQDDKPNKMFKLIEALIIAGSDPEHHNITGYNSIELAAWYDYCDDQKHGSERYNILNCMFNSMNTMDTSEIKKTKKNIIDFRKMMHQKKIQSLKESFYQPENKPVLRLKLNDDEIKEIEETRRNSELKLMTIEDTRLIENNEKLLFEMIEQEEEEKRLENEKKKLKSDKKLKKKAKLQAQKQAKLEAQRQAEIEAQRQAELKAKRQAEIEAHRQAEIEAHRQAEIEAHRQAELEAQRQAELKAKRQAELKAKRQAELETKRQAEIEAKRQAELEAKREAKLKIMKDEKMKAEQEAEKMKLENEKLKSQVENALKEVEEAKKEAEKLEKNSTTSDVTDSETNSYSGDSVVVHENYQYIDENYQYYSSYMNPQYGMPPQPSFPCVAVPIPVHVPVPVPVYSENRVYINEEWKYPIQPTPTVYFNQ